MTASSPIEQVKLLRPQPGDVIAMKLDGDLSHYQLEEFIDLWRENLQEMFPENKILFLGGGADLEVRPE